jgi:heme-degrading monooxygenase HmoA
MEVDMFARATVMMGRPETMDEAAKIFNESVIPAAKQQKGFKGALFLTAPNSGKGMSVTLWDTEDDLKAGENSGYFKEQIAKFGPLLAGPPTRELFVVAAKV